MGINKNVKIDSGDILRKRNTLPDISLPRFSAIYKQDFGESDEGTKALISGDNAGNAYSSESQLNNWMKEYENRPDFSYDFNGDAIYQQYKDKFIQQGKMAMEDTMGIASALTGGYGNSYAATVGNQAYQSYLQQLNDVIPELAQMAFNKQQFEEQMAFNKQQYEDSKKINLVGGYKVDDEGNVKPSDDYDDTDEIIATIPSSVINHIASLKSNAAREKFLASLSETLTEDQISALGYKYDNPIADYSQRKWTMRSDGGPNLFGIGVDNNAEVTDQYNNHYRLDKLVDLLVEEEGMTRDAATKYVIDLQNELGIVKEA